MLNYKINYSQINRTIDVEQALIDTKYEVSLDLDGEPSLSLSIEMEDDQMNSIARLSIRFTANEYDYFGADEQIARQLLKDAIPTFLLEADYLFQNYTLKSYAVDNLNEDDLLKQIFWS